MTSRVYHVVFDGPPSHDAPRLVEVEDGHGRSVAGTWSERADGTWVLELPRDDGDDPEVDCTDGAHPAWWRAHDWTSQRYAAELAEARAEVTRLTALLREASGDLARIAALAKQR